MSFLFPQASAAPPPPPPSLASAGVALSGEDARNAAAASAGKLGFGRTVKTSAQGASAPDTATPQLKPQMNLASVFGG